GRIIYISSALGRMGNELFPVYTSTKWAMIGVAKSAALCYGKSNILCNVVAPGLVDTPLANNPFVLSKMMPGVENPTFEAVASSGVASSTLNVAHLEAEDVAKAVVFFAGEATAKVSGEVFDLSYGSLARSIA
ncbi:MAG: SDR family oxidoreductase, partial [Planctomycetota bacterium]